MHREVEQYQHFSGNAGAGRQLPQVLNAMQGMPLLKAFLHWWHNLPLTREKPLYGLKDLFESLINRSGISRAALAEKIGLSEMQFAEREDGRIEWTAAQMQRIHECLKLTGSEANALFFA